ncbi:HlyD family type I secretion periplasmic adaptor subunit [Allochromatium palmeri]|uniref:Membrane fusion protein (MFP) family protein n=1 Tax=Allochromatium palmeri TaxID=231048 RepID=A0A6N8EL30_9GAMM|nr:HlyD family type I secretion periplasmic adaptor subunit [Allochromatium palmeri]MTW23014.1 HlyD family type I secretion periplasmic adaptor subunit [Allochromatium palmeri]
MASTSKPGKIPAANAALPLRLGWLILLGAFGGFLLWAALAPLDSAVNAAGVVVVESYHKEVQHLEGGIVKTLSVREGDEVTEGQVLLTLDETSDKATVEIITRDLFALLAAEARLQAELAGLPEVQFPPRLLERRDAPWLEEAMSAQRELFAARRRSKMGQRDIFAQRISQYQEQISGLTAQEQSRLEQLRLYEEEILGLRKLASEGNVSRNYLLEKERQRAKLKGEQGQYTAERARAELSIGETRLQLLQLDKTFREEAVNQLSNVQNRIAQTEERLVAAEDRLSRKVIRAPASGRVIGLTVHNIAEVVRPGETIMNIVPGGDELVLEVDIDPNDITHVSVGMVSTVRFSALSRRNTPIITGEVIQVAADTVSNERTGRSYYSVRVRVPPEQLALLPEVRIVPGMPVQVLILTGKRTALSYLTSPFQDIAENAMLEH